MREVRPASLETAGSARGNTQCNSLLVALTSCLIIALPDISQALEAQGESPESPKAIVAPVVPMPRDDYCANIADLAADARHVLQKKTLEDLQIKIEQKLVSLEAKRAELGELLKKRDETVRETQKALVDIFSKMRPDVAAAQFEILDVNTSTSILKQLNARVASTILNEMKAPIAAAITVRMAEPVNNAKLDNGT